MSQLLPSDLPHGPWRGLIALTLTLAFGCDASSYVDRGTRALDRDDTSLAEAQFLRALDHEPTSAEAWNGLGWALQAEQRFDEAEEAFGHCLELAQTHAPCLRGLATVRMGQGRADDARGYLAQAKAAAPHDPDVRSSEALLALASGDATSAESMLRELVAGHPSELGYEVVLLQALLRNAHAQEVLDRSHEALKRVGDRRRYRMLLHLMRMQAWLMLERGRLDASTCGDVGLRRRANLERAEEEWALAQEVGRPIPEQPRLLSLLKRQRSNLDAACGADG